MNFSGWAWGRVWNEHMEGIRNEKNDWGQRVEVAVEVTWEEVVRQ